jgi:FAD:protein FMN transferase
MTLVVKTINIYKIFKRAGTSYVSALFVSILIASGCNHSHSPSLKWSRLQGSTMGTTYHITISDIDTEYAKQLIDSALTKLNRSLSTYDSKSYISHFNHSQNGYFSDWQHDDYQIEMFREVWDLSYKYYTMSEGAFDPSASPLFQIWGFAERERTGIPNQTAIDSILTLIGFDTINFPPYGKRNESSSLNFNAIAKGYGVDYLAGVLQVAGAKNGMIEIGGEVRAFGRNDKNEYWKIGLNEPREGAEINSYIEVVELSNRSMATSGNYRNYFVHDGVKYSHTIDPRNGHPIETDLKSVTIISKDCATADALATACMVLGSKKATELVNKLPWIDALFVKEINGNLEVIKLFKTQKQ